LPAVAVHVQRLIYATCGTAIDWLLPPSNFFGPFLQQLNLCAEFMGAARAKGRPEVFTA